MSRRARRFSLAVIVTITFGLVACAGEPAPAEDAGTAETPAAAPVDAGVFEIALADFSFTAPPTAPSGWTTLRMINGGAEAHFVVLWRLPEGVTYADYAETVPPLFAREHARFAAGEITADEMMAAIGGGLPEWFAEAAGAGGVGLTSPGLTAEAVVHLEPGEYAMECYVRSADGRFHAEQGMLRPLMVTDAVSSATEPQADIDITLSNYEISVAGDLTSGEQMVAVRATQAAEGLIGHDLHLARLAPDTSLDAVVAWMSWMTALQSPAPAEFLGGAEEVEVGATRYFRVNIEPGRYAWISEGYAGMGMVQELVVE